MDSEKELTLLGEADIRVLGSLMEKSRTTPDYYPMSLNSLTAACNQKTSRSPVTNYSEAEVQNSLNRLKGLSLVSTAVGGGSRTVKYKHNFATVYPLNDAQLAVLCLLFLRGPQTPGEINTNSGRLHEFSSLESVTETLNGLSTLEPPFVKMLPRKPGQKEARYVHLLGEFNEDSHFEEAVIHMPEGLEERVSSLEKEVSELKEIIEKLKALL
jgi:uncharacterized protein